MLLQKLNQALDLLIALRTLILKLKAGGPRDLLDVRELLATDLVDKVLLADLATRYRVNTLLEKVSST